MSTLYQAVPHALPEAASAAGSEGYMLSSLELRAGLRVQEVLMSALPHEVVRELARLRRTWPDATNFPVTSMRMNSVSIAA